MPPSSTKTRRKRKIDARCWSRDAASTQFLPIVLNIFRKPCQPTQFRAIIVATLSYCATSSEISISSSHAIVFQCFHSEKRHSTGLAQHCSASGFRQHIAEAFQSRQAPRSLLQRPTYIKISVGAYGPIHCVSENYSIQRLQTVTSILVTKPPVLSNRVLAISKSSLQAASSPQPISSLPARILEIKTKN